jgi:hypothetical protein
LNNSQKLAAFKDMPGAFNTIFKSLTVKKISEYGLVHIDDNAVWLLTAILQLVSLVDLGKNFLSGKLMRYQVIKVFKDYTKSPGNFMRILKQIPPKIKSLKNPPEILKKLEASMKLVNFSKLESFQDLFYFTSECINLIKPIETPPSPLLNSSNFHSISPIRSSFMKSQKLNPSSYRSSINSSPSFKSKTPKKLQNQEFLQEKIQNFQEINKNCKILFEKLNFKSKAEKFLLESRANKRTQEKLFGFLKNQGKVDDLEEGNRLVEEFLKTLPQAEVSPGCLKFLEFFKKTKEFEKAILKTSE